MFASLDSSKLLGLKKVLSAGEALTSEAAQPWIRQHRLYNGYGPTECTIGSAIHPIKPNFGRTPPIGIPLRNMSMYILDPQFRMIPDGVIGEVYIGGCGVGVGYVGQPAMTAERFLSDPFSQVSDGRMYKTGDLGRWNKDGFIEIVGRADNQIKLRGFRIEPGEIAAAMEALPEVQSAAVLAIDDESNESGAGKRLIGYFVLESEQSNGEGNTALIASDAELERTHIDSWRTLFDESHQPVGLVFHPEDDFSGWQSVITGQAIPTGLMQEWAEASAARIRQFEPKRILEIGCGTGLILLRLGEEFDSYDGVDVLPWSIAQLQKTVATRPNLKDKVRARVGTADRLDDLTSGSYDTIVLNSVVQYFPSYQYLIRVLRDAQRLLAPGGRIFLGDLRNLGLAGAFGVDVELARDLSSTLMIEKFKRRVLNRIEHDEELMLAPELFECLRSELPRLAKCNIQYKLGSDLNELNRYRFDVTLSFDEVAGFDTSETQTLQRPELNRDGSVNRYYVLWRMISQLRRPMTMAELLVEIDGWNLPGSDWNAVAKRAKAMGVDLDASDSLFSQDCIETWSNHPLRRRRATELVAQMRDRLRERLPAYMIPSAFVPLDRLPMTVQGKLDKAALPPPPASRPEWAGKLRGPRDAHESLLVDVWEQLLEIDPIGIDDDFFELGGHSMLAVRMMSEVERRTGIAIPLAALFRNAAIAHLAELLRNPKQATSASARMPLTSGTGTPIFCIHPAGGTVFCYRPLADLFAGERSVIGLQARGVDVFDRPHETLTEMAAYYVEAIRHAQPSGPYHLLGWSLGGNIAFEVARQLQVSGAEVGMLALLDSGLMSSQESIEEADFLPLIAALFPGDQHSPLEDLREKSTEEQLEYFIRQASKAGIVPTDADAWEPDLPNIPSEYQGGSSTRGRAFRWQSYADPTSRSDAHWRTIR